MMVLDMGETEAVVVIDVEGRRAMSGEVSSGLAILNGPKDRSAIVRTRGFGRSTLA